MLPTTLAVTLLAVRRLSNTLMQVALDYEVHCRAFKEIKAVTAPSSVADTENTLVANSRNYTFSLKALFIWRK